MTVDTHSLTIYEYKYHMNRKRNTVVCADFQ